MDVRNKILIIDDSSVMRASLSCILDKVYKVRTASGGYEALDLINQELPDIILLDIVMPELDGYSVLKILRGNKATKDLQIIMLTSLKGEEIKALTAGADDFIDKNIEIELLSVLVLLRVGIMSRIVDKIKEVEQLSYRDKLTGLANRFGFDFRMDTEWRRAVREQLRVSFMILDADHFKNYNDTYGHLQGDEALKRIANTLKYTFKRPTDIVARWGGEEFIIVLVGDGREIAEKLAEKVRSLMENIKIKTEGGVETQITVSIGIYSEVPTVECNLDSFLAPADKALYQAKELGRNRFVIY